MEKLEDVKIPQEKLERKLSQFAIGHNVVARGHIEDLIDELIVEENKGVLRGYHSCLEENLSLAHKYLEKHGYSLNEHDNYHKQ